MRWVYFVESRRNHYASDTETLCERPIAPEVKREPWRLDAKYCQACRQIHRRAALVGAAEK